MITGFKDDELQKNQWHCTKCKTNWLSYLTYYDNCPFCKKKDPVLVRIGSVAQKKGAKEWWNRP